MDPNISASYSEHEIPDLDRGTMRRIVDFHPTEWVERDTKTFSTSTAPNDKIDASFPEWPFSSARDEMHFESP